MKKIILLILIPTAIYTGIPQAYNSKEDLEKLDKIITNISIIQEALTICITKLQSCADTNKANMAEIGKTSSKINDANSSFDNLLKLAKQTSNIIEQMTQRTSAEITAK
jgi:hypothetical protein